jgi:hypothetical protein
MKRVRDAFAREQRANLLANLPPLLVVGAIEPLVQQPAATSRTRDPATSDPARASAPAASS